MTPDELVLTFGGLHLCVKFGENRQRNATVRVTTHGQTDRQTHTQTDANRFYYLSDAVCYSYGADNDVVTHIDKSSFSIDVILNDNSEDIGSLSF